MPIIASGQSGRITVRPPTPAEEQHREALAAQALARRAIQEAKDAERTLLIRKMRSGSTDPSELADVLSRLADHF